MSKSVRRLEKIIELLDNIDFILESKTFQLTQAIQDKIIKPALRMNIIRIAEEFSKLKEENEFEILERFSKNDLRGISAVRNYITHDYDSTDDQIIEDVIRYNLPVFRDVICTILYERKLF